MPPFRQMKPTRKLLASSALFAVVLFHSLSAASRDDFPELFAEDTLLYIEIPSLPTLRDNWDENPFNELYQREEVREFINGLMKQFIPDFDKENGRSWLEDENDEVIWEGMLGSQIVFGVSRFDLLSMIPGPLANEASNKEIPDLWLVIDFEEKEFKKSLVEDMEEEEHEYVEYENFYIMLLDELTVSYNDDIIIISNTEETSRTLIDRYLGESSQPSLEDNENFQRSFLRLYENSEIFYYVDLSFIGELAADAASKFEDLYSPMVQNGQLAPSENILKALGLEALQGFAGSVDLDPSQQKMRSLVLLEPNNGFFGRFMGHYGNSLPDTSFLGEDLSQAMATSFDISGMLHDFEQTVFAISPFAGQLYADQKLNYEQKLSVQFDESLIDNFSGSLYLVSGVTPNTAASNLDEEFQGMEHLLDQGSTYIIGINDRVSLEALYDSFRATFDPQGFYLKEEFLGASYYSIKTPGMPFGPSLFISDQHMVYEQTNPDFGKLVMSMMQNPGDPIFERRDVRDALNELPSNPIGLTYTDAQKMLTTFTKAFSSLLPIFAQQAALNTEPGGEDPDHSLEDLPELPIIEDFEYFSITTTYKENNDIYQEGILRPKTN
jgi:hypothetical protein